MEENQETLSQVSATIARGECALLCGASGCGKTTVTKLINGLIPAFYSRMPSGGTGDGRRDCTVGNAHV